MFAICIPYTHGKTFSVDIYKTDLEFFSVYVKYTKVIAPQKVEVSFCYDNARHATRREVSGESIASEWFTC